MTPAVILVAGLAIISRFWLVFAFLAWLADHQESRMTWEDYE